MFLISLHKQAIRGILHTRQAIQVWWIWFTLLEFLSLKDPSGPVEYFNIGGIWQVIISKVLKTSLKILIVLIIEGSTYNATLHHIQRYLNFLFKFYKPLDFLWGHQRLRHFLIKSGNPNWRRTIGGWQMSTVIINYLLVLCIN